MGKIKQMMIDQEEDSYFIGFKYDQGKLRYDLLPPQEIEQIVEVLTMGAAKYSDNSWQDVENGIDRYYAAAMRHLQSWRQGEVTDNESGLPHLAHVATNIVFLMHLTKGD
jgi:hypothetical protein